MWSWSRVKKAEFRMQIKDELKFKVFLQSISGHFLIILSTDNQNFNVLTCGLKKTCNLIKQLLMAILIFLTLEHILYIHYIPF